MLGAAEIPRPQTCPSHHAVTHARPALPTPLPLPRPAHLCHHRHALPAHLAIQRLRQVGVVGAGLQGRSGRRVGAKVYGWRRPVGCRCGRRSGGGLGWSALACRGERGRGVRSLGQGEGRGRAGACRACDASAEPEPGRSAAAPARLARWRQDGSPPTHARTHQGCPPAAQTGRRPQPPTQPPAHIRLTHPTPHTTASHLLHKQVGRLCGAARRQAEALGAGRQERLDRRRLGAARGGGRGAGWAGRRRHNIRPGDSWHHAAVPPLHSCC